ncbi:MAG: hypothetical protein ACRDGI_08135 [Candidatus Limnocylindrales bacterium]
MTAWVCSRCGRRDVSVNEARPSLDDRYAVGHCPTCAPIPPPADPRRKPPAIVTVPLVRADRWDPEIPEERRRRRADELFLEKYRDGRVNADDPKIKARAVELIARYDAERVARHSA